MTHQRRISTESPASRYFPEDRARFSPEQQSFRRRQADSGSKHKLSLGAASSSRLLGRVILAIASTVSVVLFVYQVFIRDTGPLPLTFTPVQVDVPATDRICNPWSQPGYLLWNKDQSPRSAQWKTYTNDCDDAPDYFALLEHAFDESQAAQDVDHPLFRRRTQALKRVDFLKDKTLLILGDSVDRNALFHMSDLMHAGIWPSHYLNASIVGIADGWDVRGVPHVLDGWRLHFRAYNGFLYGMDDEDDFQHQVDWHAPGKAEDRIQQLIKPFIDQTESRPDFIQLHSGMWDLALWGRQDTRNDKSTAEPLSRARMDWWRQRMTSTVKEIQQTWPGVPLWIRTIHRVGSLPSLSSGDYVHGIIDDPAKVQNFFTDLRIKQLQDMQRSLARELCLPLFDFGTVWEGYQQYQDKVHPEPLPGGLAYGLPVLHHMYLESLGRDQWQDQLCQH